MTTEQPGTPEVWQAILQLQKPFESLRCALRDRAPGRCVGIHRSCRTTALTALSEKMCWGQQGSTAISSSSHPTIALSGMTLQGVSSQGCLDWERDVLSLPCFSGCPFAVKSLNNLALFSLTIWAIPHHTNYLPALPLLTYLIFFPLPIPPSLFPGTLLHHNKLQFLSHSFTQMKSPRNSSALPGPFSPSSRYAIP